MTKETKSLTASQRLEGLEASLSAIDQVMGNITTNLQTAINALTLLSDKVDAIVRLGNSGKSVNSATVAAELIAINIEDLKSRVEDLQGRGMAVLATEIQENSFVVGRELGEETKEVTNERIQFPLFGLIKETKDKLIGKKVGDIVTMGKGRNLLEITEIFNIVVPEIEQLKTNETSEAAASTEATETQETQAGAAQ